MYGPTETTIWSTTAVVDADEDPIAIGRPIANTEIYILDRHLQPVPVGVPADLYIGGAGVVRGYLNNPALTAERFVPDPFGTRNEERGTRNEDRSDSSFIVWRAAVQDRRSGALSAGWQNRVPGPHRSPGEAARLPHRAWRDRGAAASTLCRSGERRHGP
jgi:non-ribosomal peptide synthetase component F